MRREVPIVITLVVGLIMLLTNFMVIGGDGKVGFLQEWSADLSNWVIIVAAFAVGLASVNLLKIHANNITRQRPGWFNSVLLVVSLFTFAIIGTIARLNPASPVGGLNQKLFDHVMSPLGAAMFAILAFYIASASYRAFRMRSVEATILLVAAVLVMLGRAPIGELIWAKFPVISKWLLNVPNTAGQRAIMIGAAIGGFATSLRILLGIERGHLGGAE